MVFASSPLQPVLYVLQPRVSVVQDVQWLCQISTSIQILTSKAWLCVSWHLSWLWYSTWSAHTFSPPWTFQEWVESCMVDHRLVEQWAGWTNCCVLQQEKLYQTMLQRSSLMKMTSRKFVWNVQLSNLRMDDKYAVQHTCSTQFSFRLPCHGCNGATAHPYWALWPRCARFAISSVTFSDPDCQAWLTPGFSSVYSQYSYPSEWYSLVSHMRCCPRQQ